MFPFQQLHMLPSNHQCFCRGSFSPLGTSVWEFFTAFHSMRNICYILHIYVNIFLSYQSPLSTHPAPIRVTLRVLNKGISLRFCKISSSFFHNTQNISPSKQQNFLQYVGVFRRFHQAFFLDSAGLFSYRTAELQSNSKPRAAGQGCLLMLAVLHLARCIGIHYLAKVQLPSSTLNDATLSPLYLFCFCISSISQMYPQFSAQFAVCTYTLLWIYIIWFCSSRKIGIILYYLDFLPHVIVFALWISPAFVPFQLSSLQSKFNVDRLILSLPNYIPGSIVFSEEPFRFHHDNGCMHSHHHKLFPVFVAC